MECGPGALDAHALTPGETFFDELAERLLTTCGAAAGDLSAWSVLVPAMPMAVSLPMRGRIRSTTPGTEWPLRAMMT